MGLSTDPAISCRTCCRSIRRCTGPTRPAEIAGRDTRPIFATTPGPYTGPVPIVTHVHGMEGVDDWSDGYAEAWYLPAAGNIPAGFATVGTWYDFFKAKSGLAWAPGTATFKYPNSQRPSTAWYHDHTLGMTRLNVYAGPAGFYIIRSANPADNPTVAGGGARQSCLARPQLGDRQDRPIYEIPLAIQDRSFDLGGGLFYPNSRAFFDGFVGPYIPRPTSRRSGIPSSSATTWSSTARRGRSSTSSRGAIGSGCSTAASRGS